MRPTPRYPWAPALAGGLVLSLAAAGCASTAGPHNEAGLTQADAYTLKSQQHLLRDVSSRAAEGRIQAVVEIPTGTNAKWEVDKESGDLLWEFKKGKPRVVSYLGYPGNYGMIPRTLLAAADGGDGDPLDVLILGPAAPRGSVVKARLIGVLRMLDDGEQDDKLLAVLEGSPLSQVSNLQELNRDFQGVSKIIETWFANYKGPGEIEVLGFGSVADAEKILAAAETSYGR